jgi:hypothetical protein
MRCTFQPSTSFQCTSGDPKASRVHLRSNITFSSSRSRSLPLWLMVFNRFSLRRCYYRTSTTDMIHSCISIRSSKASQPRIASEHMRTRTHSSNLVGSGKGNTVPFFKLLDTVKNECPKKSRSRICGSSQRTTTPSSAPLQLLLSHGPRDRIPCPHPGQI